MERGERVDRTDMGTKIAALTAIVQTLILEHYWEGDEKETKRRFFAMAEADHPVVMAIVNELTEEELDVAFTWPGARDGDGAMGPLAAPVVAFLTEQQYERVRVAAVAEDEGDRAREFAMEEPTLPGAGPLSANERIRSAEERFVSAMAGDLGERRGVGRAARAKARPAETVAAMPEPWKCRTERELRRLREDLVEMLGAESAGGANRDWKAA